jgi:hypothetical protein
LFLHILDARQAHIVCSLGYFTKLYLC